MSPRMFFSGSARRRSRSVTKSEARNKPLAQDAAELSSSQRSQRSLRSSSPKKNRGSFTGVNSPSSSRKSKSSVSRSGTSKTRKAHEHAGATLEARDVPEQSPRGYGTTATNELKRRQLSNVLTSEVTSVESAVSKESSSQKHGRKTDEKFITETAGEDHSREQTSDQVVSREVISNLEVMGLAEQLTRRPQFTRSESDSRSGASKRSRRSGRSSKGSRSSKSQHGHCIEVQVSRTILQTAKDDNEEAHFVEEGASIDPAKSANDILEDLFTVATETGLDAVPVSDAFLPLHSWTETLDSGFRDSLSEQGESYRHEKTRYTASSPTDEQVRKSFSSEHTPLAQNLSRIPSPTHVPKRIPMPTNVPKKAPMPTSVPQKSKLERHFELTKGKPPLAANNDARTLQSNETSIFAGLESLPDEKQESAPPAHANTVGRTSMQKIHENEPEHHQATKIKLRLGTRRQQDSLLQELSEPSSYFMTANSAESAAEEEDLEGLAHVGSDSEWVAFQEDPFKKSVTPTAQLEGRFSGPQDNASFSPRFADCSPARTVGSSSERSGTSSDSPTCVVSIGRERTAVHKVSMLEPPKGRVNDEESWEPFQSSFFDG